MPLLHYGPQLRIRLDASNARQLTEAVGAHATRGGWINVTGVDGRQWSLLISAGIPIWISDDEPDSPGAAPSPTQRQREDAHSEQEQGGP